MEVGESGRDPSESGLENRGVSVKVEWFGHISVLEALQPKPKPLEALNASKPKRELKKLDELLKEKEYYTVKVRSFGSTIRISAKIIVNSAVITHTAFRIDAKASVLPTNFIKASFAFINPFIT